MGKISAFGTVFNFGTAQVETATVIGTITGNGNARVILTADGMTGSAITTDVAVVSPDTADTVATKIRAALALVANIVAYFYIGGSGAQVVLTRKAAAAVDATMNIDINNESCTGLTDAPTSTTTIAGVAYAAVAYVTNISGPGLAADTQDVTSHDSTSGWEEQVITILRSGEVSIDLIYDPNAASISAAAGLIDKVENKALGIFQLTFPGPYTWTFSGYATSFEPGAPVDGALTATVKIKITGAPTLV